MPHLRLCRAAQGLALRLWFRSLVVVVITFLAILMPFFGSIVGLSGALSEPWGGGCWMASPVTGAGQASCPLAKHPPFPRH